MGGFVLLKVLQSERFTRDLDDGFWFGDIKLKELDEQGEYGALRFDSVFQIGEPDAGKTGKLSRIHFDVGFGNKISSKLKPLESPSLLPSERPVSWKVYPSECIFSEKLQALVARGSTNSRAKDVYDLVLLYSLCADKQELKKAIRATFNARATDIPSSLQDYADSLAIKQIAISWNGVQLETENLNFKTAWAKLLKMLRELDAAGVMTCA